MVQSSLDGFVVDHGLSKEQQVEDRIRSVEFVWLWHMTMELIRNNVFGHFLSVFVLDPRLDCQIK